MIICYLTIRNDEGFFLGFASLCLLFQFWFRFLAFLQEHEQCRHMTLNMARGKNKYQALTLIVPERIYKKTGYMKNTVNLDKTVYKYTCTDLTSFQCMTQYNPATVNALPFKKWSKHLELNFYVYSDLEVYFEKTSIDLEQLEQLVTLQNKWKHHSAFAFLNCTETSFWFFYSFSGFNTWYLPIPEKTSSHIDMSPHIN